jgi:hypothetical protein
MYAMALAHWVLTLHTLHVEDHGSSEIAIESLECLADAIDGTGCSFTSDDIAALLGPGSEVCANTALLNVNVRA